MPEEQAAVGLGAEAAPQTSEVGNDLAGVEGLTDEQILGIDSETPPELEAPPETPIGEPTQEFGVAPPAWLKQMYSNPEFGKQAQALWDQTAAYRQLYPTVAEARTFKEAVEGIGGVDAIQDLVQKGQSVDQTDAAFFSGDPQQQGNVLSEMFEEDRDAFSSGVQVSLEVIKQRDPERYAGMATEILGSMLKPERFDEHIEALRESLENPDALKSLVDRMVKWADSKGLSQQRRDARLDPRQQQVARDKERLDQERNAFNQERHGSFVQSVNGTIESTLYGEIGKTLSTILPKTTEGTRNRIAKDIYTNIDSVLQKDNALRDRVRQLINPSPKQYDYSRQNQEKVQQLILTRAKQLVNGTTKKIVSDWTKDVLARNQQVNQKVGLQQTRVDITGGAPPGSGRRAPLTKEIVKEKGLSDMDILNS